MNKALAASENADKSPAFKMPDMPKISAAQSALLGSLNKGAITQPAVPLASSTSGDTAVNLNQSTVINVHGSADPSAVAGAVSDGQKGINSGLLRSVQGSIR